MAPTVPSRLSEISTQAGLTAGARSSVGGASTVLTGPLMPATVRHRTVCVEQAVPGRRIAIRAFTDDRRADR
jgi:hypothetical protein